MKQNLKYILGTIGFFLFMNILDLILGYKLDIMMNLGVSLAYLIFNLLFDKVLFKKKGN